ncbi:MAG: type IV pilus biogenesis/stability protein PilW, partial [Deltaproteobacteria bacterium]|nr:type IV pilus biogenesis/stability protein PilW [Deltaproteobacteria bacterium]
LSSGETAEAVAAFEAAHAAHPGDADILAALANVEAERGSAEAAEHYRSRLGALRAPAP